jgi:two-component system, LuxR family, sensor histidine kinase DctS
MLPASLFLPQERREPVAPMNPTPQDIPFDFDLLQRHAGGVAGRGRRAALWLLGLLFLLSASVVTLVLYLQTFEAEESLRRETADAQWLEQSARFHFRRLEDDLQVLAHRTRDAAQGASQGSPVDAINAGLLLRQPGVVLAHGWLPAQAQDASPDIQARLFADAGLQPGNADMLAIMQEVARGLRRPAYAGPLKGRGADDGAVIWLAVPLFDRGVFSGNYLASLSLTRAVDAFIPGWFKDGHDVALMDEQQMAEASRLENRPFQAFLELPGTDLALQVRNTQSTSPTVPRMFFLVALICLLGMLAALYALRRDFVKRQRIESALQAQVALRSAMENAVTIGLRAWDLRGRILYVNRAFCDMVGFDPQALVGRSAPLPYWPRDQADELELIHRDIIAQGTERSGVEVQFQHRDGHLVDVLIHEAPLNAADGEQLGWMSSVLDISERKRAERMAARQQEKLEASGRLVAMGEVASTLAHELNQPLGALSGFANGLLNRLRGGRLSDDELIGVVERMEQLSAKAGRIIQRVNAFARRREMSRQRLDACAFVRRVVEPLQRQRNADIRLLLTADQAWIDADALLLEHALLNLVSNAGHWAGEAARTAEVLVELSVNDGQLLLAVSDSGPGVSPEQRDQIFSAFFSGKDDGMGMGLAICRSVVEAHHGRIDVGPSPALGGACFTIRIPLTEPIGALRNPASGETRPEPAGVVR